MPRTCSGDLPWALPIPVSHDTGQMRMAFRLTRRNQGTGVRSVRAGHMILNALLWTVPVIGALAIVYAFVLARSARTGDPGTPEMGRVLGAVFSGIRIYRVGRYRTMYSLTFVVAVAAGVLVFLTSARNGNQEAGARASLTAVSFLLGALAADLSGIIRLMLVTRSYRAITAQGKDTRNLVSASMYKVAFYASAASGLLAVMVSVLGVSGLFALCIATGITKTVQDVPSYLVGYGCGAAFVSLFTRWSFGTTATIQAADTRANLVGDTDAKGSADNPNDQGVIALSHYDLLRDDAAYNTDLFASLVAGTIAATLLGAALSKMAENNVFVYFPVTITMFGLLASMIGMATTRFREREQDAVATVNRGYLVATLLSAMFLVLISARMFSGITRINADGSVYRIGSHWLYIAVAGFVGLAASVAFVYLPQYFPAVPWRPVHIAVVSFAIGGAFSLGVAAQVTGNMLQDGIFGTTVATMAMLMSAGYIFAMQSFAPLIINAGSVREMRNQSEQMRDEMNMLHRVGNATRVYGIGSMALVAFLLSGAYLDQVAAFRGYTPGTDGWNATHHVDIAQPKALIGGFFGLMLVLLCASPVMRAPHTMRDMLVPGALVMLTPMLVGVTLRAEGAAGFLIVATMSAILLALVASHDRSGTRDAAMNRVAAGSRNDMLPALHMLAGLVGTLLLMLVPLFT